MSRNDIVRDIALKIPRVRRAYQHLHNLTEENGALRDRLNEVQPELAASRAEATDLRQELRKARDNIVARDFGLDGELDEQGKLEARLYVLTNECQRAVAALDRTRQEATELRTRVESTAANHAQALSALADSRVELEGVLQAAQARDLEFGGVLEALAKAEQRVGELDAELAEARRIASEAQARVEAVEAHRPSLPDVAAFSQRLAALSDLVPSHDTLAEIEGKLLSRLSVIGYDLAAIQRQLGGGGGGRDNAALRNRYLDVLEASLVGLLSEDSNMSPWGGQAFDPDRRFWGRDWPASAQTMIGVSRMRNIRALVEQALADGVPGDFLEAGVWRGGACIYMRGILDAYGVADRKVWVADSFAGLPKPDEKRYPADRNDPHHTFTDLVVSLEDVKRSFERYGLLDDQVAFLPGWFKDTLPGAPIARLAVLRLDGDMYGSTMETLEALYPRVAPGGYVIVDDYILKPCAKAVDDYRRRFGIREALVDVDGAAVFWRKN
jgi:O-methyltransferase